MVNLVPTTYKLFFQPMRGFVSAFALFTSERSKAAMKKSIHLLVAFALAAATSAFAQKSESASAHAAALEAKQQYVGAASVDATTTCTYNFTAGTGNKYIKYCVTKNGNIVSFESPQGHQQISTAPIGEGYAFCDFDASKAYYDYAGYGDSGNWNAPVTSSSSASSVKIVRTTSDGLYTLTQTIFLSSANSLAQVTMALKNNSSVARHVGLLRYADVDADNNVNDNFDYTFRNVFGYNEMGYGLLLTHFSGSFLNGGFSQTIPGGPNPCNIFNNVSGPLQGVDGSIFMQYDMELAKGAAGTVVVQYKGF
jgi:hypothetical protein